MIDGLSIRLAVESDIEHWKRWVADPKTMQWFPFESEDEIETTARYLFSFLSRHLVVTAELDGRPCGIVSLVIDGYRKTMHQAGLVIVVAETHRNLGVGSLLLQTVFARGKNCHGLKLILLDVFEGNPARSLYRRMGFVEFGFQPFYTRIDGQFLGRHLMCKTI